jgi:CPA2 family monovalent cation:H+ antiporter-2
MPETQHLPIVIVLLAAAVIAVALFRKLRVSPVLGYLVAGSIIGPGGLSIVSDVGSMGLVAELGVVFLLFIIGLELSWERLTLIRKQAFFLGILQILVTAALIAFPLLFLGFSVELAVIVGCGLALSSTALVMQLVEEFNQKASQLGRISLAILLIQDLAVVPLLVLVPALANSHNSLTVELMTVIAKALLALVLIFFLGRIILRPLYRVVASLNNPEIFTALTLLVVLGTGWLTYRAGLSLALGAFMAGLLMAETEYRHQVEADVMPYKGLLLGLFFMAIGMSADIPMIMDNFLLILMFALALLAVKAACIILLCRLLGFGPVTAVQTGCLLAQGGEFSFILFKIAADNNFMESHTTHLLTLVVVLSMALTPFATAIGRLFASDIEHKRRRKAEDSASEIIDVHDHVIILGFGRVGQTIAKLLSAENINYIALDMQIGTVARAKKIGLPVYYGDGSRREVLHAIGIERASAAIVTLNNPAATESAVRTLRTVAPQLPIIARALDLRSVLKIEAAGANLAVSEMFETSLQLGWALLKALGVEDKEMLRIMRIFRDRDYALAQGTIDIENVESGETPYNKMLAFQKAVVSTTLPSDKDN